MMKLSKLQNYRKDLKYFGTQKITVIFIKYKQMWFYYRAMLPKDAVIMGNCVDPGQTVHSGTV